MATDSFGNWISGLSPAATPEATSGVSQLRWGPGAPSSDLGNVGDGYVRASNGDFYTKKDSGWELQVGGEGGGSVQVLSGPDADPNDLPYSPDDPSAAAIYYQTGADSTVMWKWLTASNEWAQIFG